MTTKRNHMDWREPSLPSHPSPIDMSDEAKEARMEYDRLSALARKKSETAAR